ncbi:MAG: hypothetical protein HZB68_03355 [Candidatus Aenigmarchaeota archaeon]|nr:hypothetical protein [Candidatus Aenigmarchaeota archaeon]
MMGTIERGKKKALAIEAPFEGDTNVFKMYADICETAGVEKGTLKIGEMFHIHSYINDILFRGTDNEGDGFSIRINKYGSEYNIEDLKAMLSGKSLINDAFCVVKDGRCKDTDNGYDFTAFNDVESAISEIHVVARRNLKQANHGISVELYTSRPNHFLKELAELEDKLKEKLKVYGANLKSV